MTTKEKLAILLTICLCGFLATMIATQVTSGAAHVLLWIASIGLICGFGYCISAIERINKNIKSLEKSRTLNGVFENIPGKNIVNKNIKSLEYPS